jgi:hypothetical protein
MFAFYLAGVFMGLWQNKPGDIFFDLTVKSLRWDGSKVSLFYYDGILEAPLYQMSDDKELILLERVGYVDEENPGTYEERMKIAPVPYVIDGDKKISC